MGFLHQLLCQRIPSSRVLAGQIFTTTPDHATQPERQILMTLILTCSSLQVTENNGSSITSRNTKERHSLSLRGTGLTALPYSTFIVVWIKYWGFHTAWSTSMEHRWAFEEHTVSPLLLNSALCHTSPQTNLLRVSPPTSTQAQASGQICLPSFSWVVSVHRVGTQHSPNSPENRCWKPPSHTSHVHF